MKITIETNSKRFIIEDISITIAYEAWIACYQMLLGVGFSSESVKDGLWELNSEINPNKEI